MNKGYTVLTDYKQRAVCLTDERWMHILGHPEMVGQRERVIETLTELDIVLATAKDTAVHTYHRFYKQTPVTQKYLVVAVKILQGDAYVLTAYFTSQPRRGDVIWQR